MTSKLVAYLYRRVRNGNAKQMLLYALLQTVPAALFDKFLDRIYSSPYSGVYVLPWFYAACSAVSSLDVQWSKGP